MLKINNTYVHDDGKIIKYDYSYSSTIKKYFNKTPFYATYDVDVSNVPISILNLPFLANLLPISWFVGFDIEVNELDRTFYQQALKLKEQFAEYHPTIKTKKSNLIVRHLIEPSKVSSNKKAMLYSGGVDAYATLLRHFEEVPDLIIIKGVDMALSDEAQWQSLVQYNNNAEVIRQNTAYYIESNLREFITFDVNRLITGLDWYGTVQHGLAITCLTSPLAYLNNYSVVYIASSLDRKEGYEFIHWGSLPEIDNLIKFNNTNIYHDGSELTRQEKVNYIVEWAVFNKSKIQLRVCYSNKTNNLNCGRCSKCLTTIFAILNTNRNPNDFGFQVDFAVFKRLKDLLKHKFKSQAALLFWKEVYVASQTNTRFNFNDEDWKQAYIEIDQILQKSISRPLKEVSFVQKWKFISISKFPRLFTFYLKIRRKIL